MRLIDADALLYIYKQNSITDIVTIHDKTPMQHLKEAPTIDAVPVVHAMWIPSSVDPADPYFRCSNCRHGRDTIYFQGDEYNFCPNCGAKMDGGADNETD